MLRNPARANFDAAARPLTPAPTIAIFASVFTPMLKKKPHRGSTKRPARDRHLAEDIAFEPKAKQAPTFYHRVYAIVEQIPIGKVTTYGAIAEVLGMKRSSRMVGQALTALPADSD